MPTTYLFSAPELTQLIQRSRAIAGLSPEKRQKVENNLENSESPAAHQLYTILLQERDTYKQIEKEYLLTTNQIMSEFQNEITHLKTEKLRNQQANTEQKAATAESTTVEALLKSLNN